VDKKQKVATNIALAAVAAAGIDFEERETPGKHPRNQMYPKVVVGK